VYTPEVWSDRSPPSRGVASGLEGGLDVDPLQMQGIGKGHNAGSIPAGSTFDSGRDPAEIAQGAKASNKTSAGALQAPAEWTSLMRSEPAQASRGRSAPASSRDRARPEKRFPVARRSRGLDRGCRRR